MSSTKLYSFFFLFISSLFFIWNYHYKFSKILLEYVQLIFPVKKKNPLILFYFITMSLKSVPTYIMKKNMNEIFDKLFALTSHFYKKESYKMLESYIYSLLNFMNITNYYTLNFSGNNLINLNLSDTTFNFETKKPAFNEKLPKFFDICIMFKMSKNLSINQKKLQQLLI